MAAQSEEKYRWQLLRVKSFNNKDILIPSRRIGEREKLLIPSRPEGPYRELALNLLKGTP